MKKDQASPKHFTGDPFINDLLKPCDEIQVINKTEDRSKEEERTESSSKPTANSAAEASPRVEAKKEAEAPKESKAKSKSAAPKKKKFERPKIVYRRKRLDLDTDEYRDRAQALLAKHTDIILQKRKDAFFQLLKQLCPYIIVERSGSRTLRTYLVDTRRKKRYRTYSDAIKGGALDPLIIATGTTVLLKGCIDEAQRRFAILKRQAAEKKKQEDSEKLNGSRTQEARSGVANQGNEPGRAPQNNR